MWTTPRWISYLPIQDVFTLGSTTRQPTLSRRRNRVGVGWHPGCNVDGANNYLFADIKGKGHFVGINYYIHCPSPMWYGEGDDLIIIDGEPKKALRGTGTEDFLTLLGVRQASLRILTTAMPV